MQMKMFEVLIIAFCFLVGSKAMATPETGVITNEKIGNHPHAVDYIFAGAPESAIVFLHGGGGHKENVIYDLGLYKDETGQELSSEARAWLLRHKVLMVFPQGQTLEGYKGWTWNNYVMNSGQNDLLFLRDLVESLRRDTRFSRVKNIYLAGHSNGGMMAQRVWCESPELFAGYASIAGPASRHLLPSGGTHPCAPTTYKPFFSMIGTNDTVLKTTDNMNEPLWTINKFLRLGNHPTWTDKEPMLINDKIFFASKAKMKCGENVEIPEPSERVNTYKACNGSLRLMVITQKGRLLRKDGGDHCLLRKNGPCRTTLAGSTGIDYKTEIVNFFEGLHK